MPTRRMLRCSSADAGDMLASDTAVRSSTSRTAKRQALTARSMDIDAPPGTLRGGMSGAQAYPGARFTVNSLQSEPWSPPPIRRRSYA